MIWLLFLSWLLLILESLYDKLFREAQKRFQEVFQKGEDLLKDEWKKHPRHWADSGPAK